MQLQNNQDDQLAGWYEVCVSVCMLSNHFFPLHSNWQCEASVHIVCMY